jgi:hypothetical protein
MSTSTITVGGRSVTLVATPSTPGLRLFEVTLHDSVALDASPFTGQTQAQQWLGADPMKTTMTLPPLTLAQEADWSCFLMELRGQANAFQIGFPLRTAIAGSGAGTPLVDNTGSGANAAGMQTLTTKGWTHSATGVLKRGDWFQADYRLYRATSDVDADSSGNAVVPIFPSLREQPTDSGALTLANAKGLWRLATNDRGWSMDVTRLSRMSFQIQEWR